jgi:hypothetical protein
MTDHKIVSREEWADAREELSPSLVPDSAHQSEGGRR